MVFKFLFFTFVVYNTFIAINVNAVLLQPRRGGNPSARRST